MLSTRYSPADPTRGLATLTTACLNSPASPIVYSERIVEFLSQIGNWISENEALLSGLAAMIVVTGVIFTPLGLGLGRLFRGAREATDLRESTESRRSVEARDEPSNSNSPQFSAPSDRPSIAVLPFLNISADREQEFLAEGMTEDIITGLAATRHLYVVSRNSTFAYKGQSPDIREVGRALGVRYVLEGSVRRVGEKLRTTVQLINAASGNHLWAEKYDRPYTEMFEVQDEVVSDIAGALSLQISSAEISRNRRKPPSSLGAWELVQRGLNLTLYESPCLQSSRSALEALRAAVKLDPEYAYARAACSWFLFSAAINGWTEDPMGTLQEGQAELRAALELDTTDPLTQYYLGAAYVYSGRHEKAVHFLEQSLASNPHQPDAMVHLALAWGYLGEFARAYAYFDRVDRMVPNRIGAGPYAWYRGIILCLEERYEEAIPIIGQVLEHIPRYATARITLAIAYEAIGQPDKAKAAVQRASELDPGLCVDGIALNLSAHPNPERGREREALLRRYWPAA
jgi:TolB-like protein